MTPYIDCGRDIPAGKEIPVHFGLARCLHCECRRQKRARLLRASTLAILAAALVSSMPYCPAIGPVAPTSLVATIRDIADAHGVPSDILVGVAFAESSFNRYAVSDDGLDLGMFQLRSLFAAERAEKWGEFDAFNPIDSARIAALILREHHARFGSWDKAIAAYRQGARGVRRYGVDRGYVARVRKYADL